MGIFGFDGSEDLSVSPCLLVDIVTYKGINEELAILLYRSQIPIKGNIVITEFNYNVPG